MSEEEQGEGWDDKHTALLDWRARSFASSCASLPSSAPSALHERRSFLIEQSSLFASTEKLLSLSQLQLSSVGFSPATGPRGSQTFGSFGEFHPRRGTPAALAFIPAVLSQARLPTQLDGTDWPEPEPAERRAARALAFGLNLSILWAFQSLLSAQALYEARWPGSHLAFRGTVAFATAMSLGQATLVATGVGARASFSARLVPGFVGLAAVGMLVLLRPSAPAIVLAFGAVGLLNCITEAPLYSIAAQCWPDDGLTVALNSGNGAAGVANVLLLALLRGGLAAREALRGATDAHAAAGGAAAADGGGDGGGGALELATQLFLGLMVVVSLGAVGLYLALMRLPTIAARSAARTALALADGGGGLRALLSAPLATLATECAPYAAVWPAVRLAAACQFALFATSLAAWPGVACAAAPRGWLALRAPDWFCSPLVIGLYNATDLIGRLLAGAPAVARALPLRRCAQLTAARVLLLLPLALSAAPPLLESSALVLVIVCGIGGTNGLLATRTMCLGPELVPAEARGVAADLMVLALYWGIAVGALLGLAYGELLL